MNNNNVNRNRNRNRNNRINNINNNNPINRFSPSRWGEAIPGPAIFFKKCKNSLCITLFTLERDCLDQGITPGKLKEGHIIPTQKGSCGTLSTSGTFITWSRCLRKLSEIISCSSWDANDKFNLNQQRLSNYQPCPSQLLTYSDRIISILEEGLNVETLSTLILRKHLIR